MSPQTAAEGPSDVKQTEEVGSAEAIGPILLGLKKPVHVLQLGSTVRSIVNMALIAVIDAQMKSSPETAEELNKIPWWKRNKKTL